MVWMLTIKPSFCWKELETVPLPQINPTSRYCPNKSDTSRPGSWLSGVTKGGILANQRPELWPSTNETPDDRGSSMSGVTRLLIDRIPGEIETRQSVTLCSEIWSQDWHPPDIQHSGQWHTILLPGGGHIMWPDTCNLTPGPGSRQGLFVLCGNLCSLLRPGMLHRTR